MGTMTKLDLERARLRAIAAADEALARLAEIPDTGEIPAGPTPHREGVTYQAAPGALDQATVDEWIKSVRV